MNKAAIYFAYLCIYTTPIQLFILGWISLILFQTDNSILGYSTKAFLFENLKFFHDWIYSWFWNAYLDFWYQFPALIMTTLKIVLSTWLGFWLLKKFK